MATSLQELLAEEGFKGRNSGSGSRLRSRASIRLEAFSNTDSPPSHVAKTERRRSDASRFTSRADLSRSDSTTTTHMKPRDHLVRREKLNVGGLEGRGSSEDFRVSEIVEIGLGETERVKQVFANVGRHSLGRRDKRNDDASSTKRILNRRSYSDKNRNNPKQKDAAYDSIQPFPQPALDEVAVQAVVSILSGYIKRFLLDEEFRAALHLKCFSSLDFIGLEDHDIEGKVIVNLEQAIGIVEKAVREPVSGRELKMSSLQLSVITGLNSNDLKDGFTYGVPNSMLSSCAHLYLSVIYKLQKKDRVSARHLLQVFCDSPSHARMNLLPELWEDLFSPHLSHLEAWYDQEASSLSDAPREGKLKLLEKVYNEIMDSSTYRLATYYKDWLTEGVEAPSFPSIRVPSVSIQSIHQEDSLPHSPGLATPTSPFSPQPTMVSKKLYESVFRRSSKPGLEETEDNESHYYDTCGRSSDSSTIYVKQTLTCSSEIVKYSYQNNGEATSKSPRDDASFLEDGISSRAQDYDKLHAPVHSTANELVLKRLAKSVFELQQTKITDDLTLSSLPNLSEDLDRKDFICPLTGKLFEDPVTLETGQTFERVAIEEWFNQGNRTCPVTGNLLELLSVPHTNIILKRVIHSWKSENCSQNLALAFSIVGNTKEHGLPNRGETATFILDQFLTTLSKEERITNTKHLISLGGLPFLIQRFNAGNMQEKIRVASLLSCCIEADSVCRYRIAIDINKQCLFELVCSKQVNSRTNAVLLLTELICLSRRKDVTLFLSDLQDEEIMTLMHALHEHLRKISPVQRPLVATLLLNINLLVDPQKHAIYKRDAVDAITEALDCSLIDVEVREECCRMLRMLGGRFSLSGKLLIEDWILKVAGFDDDHEVNSIENDSVLSEDEECAIAEWLRNLSSSLVGNGKRSFLEAISKCLGSGNRDLVTACLTTVGWLTSVLPIQSDAGLQKTFCTLISQLKRSLENDAHVQHKVLASMSLLNLSKISEYRVLLMSIAEEMVIPLRNLADVTWTAKELYAIISCT